MVQDLGTQCSFPGRFCYQLTIETFVCQFLQPLIRIRTINIAACKSLHTANTLMTIMELLDHSVL